MLLFFYLTKKTREIILLVSLIFYLAELVNVVVEVGFNFGLLHKLSAPPCKNQGGNGLLVVVAKTRCAHAKCTSTYLLVPGQGSPKTSEFTGIRHSCF